MRKYAMIGVLSLVVAMLLSVTNLSEVRAEVDIPEDPAPDACAEARRRGKACDRWYQMGAPKVIVLHGIQFDSGSARIKPSSMHILDENVAQLRNRRQRIRIEGHTDSDGSSQSNQELSEARARSVMNYFASKGVSTRKMSAVGRGENQPVASNATRAGKAQNRRIELHTQ